MKILEKTQNKLVCKSEPNMETDVFLLIIGLGSGGSALWISLSNNHIFNFNLLFVIIGFVMAGASIYDMTVVETYIFDKTRNKLIQQRRSCLGTQVKEYTFLEIVDVRVEETTDSDGDFNGYRISLLLTGSKSLIL